MRKLNMNGLVFGLKQSVSFRERLPYGVNNAIGITTTNFPAVRVNQLGWLALVFARATPPDSSAEFCGEWIAVVGSPGLTSPGSAPVSP